jgi:hypothetical protein
LEITLEAVDLENNHTQHVTTCIAVAKNMWVLAGMQNYSPEALPEVGARSCFMLGCR